MEKIDFSKYTIDELKSALLNIDKEQYPDNYAEVQALLWAKLSDTLLVAQNQLENNFFCNHVPSEVVTEVWLRVLGWGFVFTLVVFLPISFVLSFLMFSMGYDHSTSSMIENILSLIASLVVSWFATRKALGARLESFEISFYRKEK